MSLMCKIGSGCTDKKAGMCIHEKLMIIMVIAGLAVGHFAFGWY